MLASTIIIIHVYFIMHVSPINFNLYILQTTILTFILILDGPKSGDVRLSDDNRGRVDVFLSGMWLPVADSNRNWTMDNSEVVCRELGYAPDGK